MAELASLKAIMHEQACAVMQDAEAAPLVRYGATGTLSLHELTTTQIVGPWWLPWSRRATHMLAQAATTPRARERGGVVALWMDEITQTHMCAQPSARFRRNV